MGTSRTLARQPAQAERKPAPRVPARAASPAAPAQLLQRRLGNQGAAAYIARSALRVSSPQDPAEKEAVAKAADVMRMPNAAAQVSASASTAVQRCACEHCACESGANHTHADVPDAKLDVKLKEASPGGPARDVSHEIESSMSSGSPLSADVRAFMEPRFGADFSGVRIHTGEHAAQLSENLNAHAFTVGNHVYFGKGQYQPEAPGGKELIAHELTHTIQQGAIVQRSAGDAAVLIQRDEDKRSWWEKLTDWGESFAWDMVRTVAPSAVPVLQKGPSGVLDWIGEKVSAAVDGVFNALMAPVRAISGNGSVP